MGIDAVEWAKKVTALGAGEILLTSMDCDGTEEAGYDLELTKSYCRQCVSTSDCFWRFGTLEHFNEALTVGAQMLHWRLLCFIIRSWRLGKLRHT